MAPKKRNQKSVEIDPSEICLTKKQKLEGPRHCSIAGHNGAITYIHLKDFMGHQEFEWTPGPRVNIVTGIGKSSILNAIRIGLGKNFCMKNIVVNGATPKK